VDSRQFPGVQDVSAAAQHCDGHGAVLRMCAQSARSVKTAMKLIIFGAGNIGKRCIETCSTADEILAVADNRSIFRSVYGHRIIRPAEICDYEFDKIIIAIDDSAFKGMGIAEDITKQLLGMGIERDRLQLHNIRQYDPMFKPRSLFLREWAAENPPVDAESFVAEAGVYRGEFASVINECFPNNKLLLFDSFVGFSAEDIEAETSDEAKKWLSPENTANHAKGSEKMTLLRCPHYRNAAVRKGYIPKTLDGLENERYWFVNLDMDLYSPTLSALKYFLPRIIPGGMLCLHDYYCDDLPGIKQAVFEVALPADFIRVPVGDGYSLALIRSK
jgi:hypothetical protein